MAHSLLPQELKELVSNQKDLNNVSPVTTRATFKLSVLLDLLEEIQKCTGFKKDSDTMHNVCITFVRQNVKTNSLKFLKPPSVKGKNKKGENVTQLIPIITGCRPGCSGP